MLAGFAILELLILALVVGIHVVLGVLVVRLIRRIASRQVQRDLASRGLDGDAAARPRQDSNLRHSA